MSPDNIQLKRGNGSNARPMRFGFLLFDDFPLLPFSGMIDVLRDCAYVTGVNHYEWHTLSIESKEVMAMNGLRVTTDFLINDAPELDVIVVCAGLNGHLINDSKSFAWLRQQLAQNVSMGAIATGTWVLAQAGLLATSKCTLHWEDIPAFVEKYPRINVTRDLFVFDRHVFTCAGGTAAIDMFLNLVAIDLGPEISGAVARQIMYQSVRSQGDHQPSNDSPYHQILHPPVNVALTVMREHLENPVSVAEIAKRANISQKQLERHFKYYFDTTPQLYYRSIRLEHAKNLIYLTDMSIIEIAVTLGFSTSSYFAKCYAQKFGVSPTQDRKTRPRYDLSLRESWQPDTA